MWLGSKLCMQEAAIGPRGCCGCGSGYQTLLTTEDRHYDLLKSREENNNLAAPLTHSFPVSILDSRKIKK